VVDDMGWVVKEVVGVRRGEVVDGMGWAVIEVVSDR